MLIIMINIGFQEGTDSIMHKHTEIASARISQSFEKYI
jgi:hypothetical protein